MLISVFTEHGIKQVPISIDGTVQVTPAATDFDVRLVQIPGGASLAATFGAKILTDHRRKSELPGPYGLVADLESTLQKEFCHIAETELVFQTPENSEQYDVSRKMEIVEGRISAFIKAPSALTTEEGSIPQRGLVLSPGCGL